MSATEIVRRLLDERGVEWRERVWGGKHSVTTFWHARGVRWHYRENRFGELRLHADGLAPEQAIAATLGSCNCTNNCTNSERTETCRIENRNGDWYCTGCGEVVGTCDTASELCIDGNAIELWHFCPNCGRRIVDPTTNDVDAEVDA